MRLKPVRITVQMLMVLIAAGTLIIVAPFEMARSGERRVAYSELSSTHASQQVLHENAAAECERRVRAIQDLISQGETEVPAWATQFATLRGEQPTGPDAATRFYEREAGRFRRWAEYEAALKAKYATAARSPWRAVAPDPPLPE